MHHDSSDQTGFAVIEGLLIVVILAIIVFAGWFVLHAKHNADVALKNANSVSQTTPATAKTTGTGSTKLSPGTDNSSLQSDLNNISSSQNQASQDSSSANSGLNDQQNEISVPTN